MASATSNAHTAGEKSRHVACLLMERDQDDYIGDDASHLESSDRVPGPTSLYPGWCKASVRTTFLTTTLPRLFLCPQSIFYRLFCVLLLRHVIIAALHHDIRQILPADISR